MTQAFATIVREESLTALWKGHLTGQVLSMSFTTANLLWFDFLTRLVADMWPGSIENPNSKLLTHFCCGGTAASLTMLTSQPIDVVRTRFVAQGEPRVYTSIADACRKILANEGVRGFYKGAVPAIILVAPESAFRFAIYQFLNSQWTKFYNIYASKVLSDGERSPNIGMLQSGVNGSLSGVAAKTLVYPFDLAKKRLQIQGFEEARKPFGKVEKFTGLLNCFSVTIKKEGMRGIYKGYVPSMWKAAASSGTIFFLYELFSNLARSLKS